MGVSTKATRCMQGILSRNRDLWQCVFRSDLAKRYRVKSGEAYASGQDQKARWLRDMAEAEEVVAKRMRTEYDNGEDEESSWDDLARLIVERGGWGETDEAVEGEADGE